MWNVIHHNVNVLGLLSLKLSTFLWVDVKPEILDDPALPGSYDVIFPIFTSHKSVCASGADPRSGGRTPAPILRSKFSLARLHRTTPAKSCSSFIEKILDPHLRVIVIWKGQYCSKWKAENGQGLLIVSGNEKFVWGWWIEKVINISYVIDTLSAFFCICWTNWSWARIASVDFLSQS